jgi:3-oxoacyl-[acyl-carrier-protein] synthase-3
MRCSMSLVGTASEMPETVVYNDFFGIGDDGNGMFRGPKQRRHVVGESAADLVSRAARKLADRLGLDVSADVDLMLTNVTCTDLAFSGVGATVSKMLGCRPKWILDLHNTGCISFVYMLGVAREFIASGAVKTALLCCAQTSAGRVFRHEENRARPQSAIPGDGCGVGYVVANDSSPVRSVVQRSYGEYADDMQILSEEGRAYWEPHRGALHVNFTEQRIANIVMRANSMVPDVVREACKAAEVDPKDLDALITNQPNAFLLSYWRKALLLPKERQIETFDEYGNLFGAAIPVGIERGIETGRIKKGSRVALGGFSHAGDYAAAAVWSVGAP